MLGSAASSYSVQMWGSAETALSPTDCWSATNRDDAVRNVKIPLSFHPLLTCGF